MKFPLLTFASFILLAATCFADDQKPATRDPNEPLTGQDLLPNVKLVVRADKGENLTEDEKGRAQLMVAYIKGFTDGLHPMGIMYPQGPVLIPETTTIGEFARNLEQYLTHDEHASTETCTLAMFNCAFTFYQNPNFNPALLPKRVPVPAGMLPKKQ